jgi:hypothetical protein
MYNSVPATTVVSVTLTLLPPFREIFFAVMLACCYTLARLGDNHTLPLTDALDLCSRHCPL